MDSKQVKYKDGLVSWYNSNGKLHRTDGPAITTPNGRVYWCFNGEKYSFDEWCDQVGIDEKRQFLLRIRYAPR